MRHIGILVYPLAAHITRLGSVLLHFCLVHISIDLIRYLINLKYSHLFCQINTWVTNFNFGLQLCISTVSYTELNTFMIKAIDFTLLELNELNRFLHQIQIKRFPGFIFIDYE